MSSATVKKRQRLSERITRPVEDATNSVQRDEKSGSHWASSKQRSAAKKPPSRQQADPSPYQDFNDLSDVTFLRLPDVKAITGLSKTSLYALIREKDFPAPVRLGSRAVAWVRSEVRQWAVDRVHASRSVA
jgi:predicted DNA-binding transcriptional regulator AlpA